MPTLDDVKMEEVAPGIDPETPTAPAAETAPSIPGIPEWVTLPDGFKFPKGKQAIFVRCMAGMTDEPAIGDRVAILWSLTVGDERLARQRAQAASGGSTYEEFAKQMIRAIDGTVVDWSRGVHQVAKFWESIGPKYRAAITALYLQFHSFTDEERARFFVNDIAVRTGI